MTELETLIANSKLHWSDYIVVVIYLLIVIGVGIWVSRHRTAERLLIIVTLRLSVRVNVWTSVSSSYQTLCCRMGSSSLVSSVPHPYMSVTDQMLAMS